MRESHPAPGGLPGGGGRRCGDDASRGRRVDHRSTGDHDRPGDHGHHPPATTSPCDDCRNHHRSHHDHCRNHHRSHHDHYGCPPTTADIFYQVDKSDFFPIPLAGEWTRPRLRLRDSGDVATLPDGMVGFVTCVPRAL